LFESERAYRDRVYLEGKERIVEDSTGSAPKQRFFEGNDAYRSRIAHDANERIIESISGSAPKQGFFESDDRYRSRIHYEADERVIEGATGSVPRQRFFEGTEAYRDRTSREANARIVETARGAEPRQRFFEGSEAFRSRVNREAKEIKASRVESTVKRDSRDEASYSYSGSGSSSASSRPFSGPSIKTIVIGLFAVGLFIVAWNSYHADQERQRQLQKLLAEQRAAVQMHLDIGKGAAARNDFDMAAREFRAAYGSASNNPNLQQQIVNAQEALFSEVSIPARGTSAPFSLVVEVACSLQSFGGCIFITLKDTRRIVFRDPNWTATTKAGGRFTPTALVAFLGQYGKRFGPFQSAEAGFTPLYFESTDGRPKSVFFVK
jgi:hypothetical protein